MILKWLTVVSTLIIIPLNDAQPNYKDLNSHDIKRIYQGLILPQDGSGELCHPSDEKCNRLPHESTSEKQTEVQLRDCPYWDIKCQSSINRSEKVPFISGQSGVQLIHCPYWDIQCQSTSGKLPYTSAQSAGAEQNDYRLAQRDIQSRSCPYVQCQNSNSRSDILQQNNNRLALNGVQSRNCPYLDVQCQNSMTRSEKPKHNNKRFAQIEVHNGGCAYWDVQCQSGMSRSDKLPRSRSANDVKWPNLPLNQILLNRYLNSMSRSDKLPYISRSEEPKDCPYWDIPCQMSRSEKLLETNLPLKQTLKNIVLNRNLFSMSRSDKLPYNSRSGNDVIIPFNQILLNRYLNSMSRSDQPKDCPYWDIPCQMSRSEKLLETNLPLKQTLKQILLNRDLNSMSRSDNGVKWTKMPLKQTLKQILLNRDLNSMSRSDNGVKWTKMALKQTLKQILLNRNENSMSRSGLLGALANLVVVEPFSLVAAVLSLL
ncbi:uncharacterized protein LOC125237194 isoform X2 [Leguminivora glycinivorella]|uniref:uncharacterized protein LOC125237194 isoform X2 n=1 Tax=Leguminivora glycinivorella TaxID=1035111 RepID=UPI0020104A59|nr:uncharacterized protein LOC125237194 isoform X2 [Leguminivora glycinivorella]